MRGKREFCRLLLRGLEGVGWGVMLFGDMSRSSQEGDGRVRRGREDDERGGERDGSGGVRFCYILLSWTLSYITHANIPSSYL